MPAAPTYVSVSTRSAKSWVVDRRVAPVTKATAAVAGAKHCTVLVREGPVTNCIASATRGLKSCTPDASGAVATAPSGKSVGVKTWPVEGRNGPVTVAGPTVTLTGKSCAVEGRVPQEMLIATAGAKQALPLGIVAPVVSAVRVGTKSVAVLGRGPVTTPAAPTAM